MPTIMPLANVPGEKEPFIWVCSSCEANFSLEKMLGQHSVSEFHKIDAEFRLHCKRNHPGQPVVGLEIKNPTEDASQMAARIVREATED